MQATELHTHSPTTRMTGHSSTPKLPADAVREILRFLPFEESNRLKGACFDFYEYFTRRCERIHSEMGPMKNWAKRYEWRRGSTEPGQRDDVARSREAYCQLRQELKARKKTGGGEVRSIDMHPSIIIHLNNFRWWYGLSQEEREPRSNRAMRELDIYCSVMDFLGDSTDE